MAKSKVNIENEKRFASLSAALHDDTEYIQTWPVRKLHESPRNPRKTFNAIKLAELADSIIGKGIINPLLALPSGEIIAGHRRYRAAQIAGLASVPVLIRDLTPDQALEIMTIDNVQREDVHPLEEGDGYAELLGLPGYDVATVAEKIGKSESYVRGRLKLTQLVPEVREAFLDGSITFGHARLIAPLPPEQQPAALKEGCFEEVGWGDKQGSIELQDLQYLRDWIEENGARPLDKAPFDRTDARLYAEAGPCTTCAFASGTNLSLLPADDGELCSRPECYDSKVAAHIARRVEEDHLVQISMAPVAVECPKEVLRTDKFDFIRYRKADEAEETDTLCSWAERAIVALIPGDMHPRAGHEAWICRTDTCETHAKRRSASSGSSGGGGASNGGDNPDVDDWRRQNAETEARHREEAALRKRGLQHLLTLDWSDAIDRRILPSLLLTLIHTIHSKSMLSEMFQVRAIEEPKSENWDCSKHHTALFEWARDTACDREAQTLAVELLLVTSVERTYGPHNLIELALEHAGTDLATIAKQPVVEPKKAAKKAVKP